MSRFSRAQDAYIGTLLREVVPRSESLRSRKRRSAPSWASASARLKAVSASSARPSLLSSSPRVECRHR